MRGLATYIRPLLLTPLIARGACRVRLTGLFSGSVGWRATEPGKQQAVECGMGTDRGPRRRKPFSVKFYPRSNGFSFYSKSKPSFLIPGPTFFAVCGVWVGGNDDVHSPFLLVGYL